MTIDDFLCIPYERNARGPRSLDCWGLVRLAREHLAGKGPMPMFNSVASGDVRAMTREVLRTARMQGCVQCGPRHGAIATCWSGKTCPHVGIVLQVDGELRVLDTDIATGAKLSTLRQFANRFTKVIFYDN